MRTRYNEDAERKRKVNSMRTILLFFVALLVLSSCGTPKVLPAPKQVIIYGENGAVTIDVEIAANETAYEKGLSGRDGLEENKGMLFVFANDRFLNFWMKDMKFPLDVLFIASDNKIVGVQTMPVCLEEPCPVFTSKKIAQYALEVSQGYAAKNKIKPGNTVVLGKEVPR